ncbi:MAG: oxygen-independent coproporphyrinogen III oxidase [Halioglobus sp.]
MVSTQFTTHTSPKIITGEQTELASHYFRIAPQHISYPTNGLFRPDFPASEFDTWKEEYKNRTPAPLSLYVHLPFCQNLCYFCSCNKTITHQEGAVTKYLDHLKKEISRRALDIGEQRPITRMHWGGGTPSYLDNAETTRLMHTLASHFNLLADETREYSIEIDPRCTDLTAMALLKGLGFNHISIGIHDFDPLVQRAINRVQAFKKVAELVNSIRAHGFETVTFDMIYGLPHQDSWTISETLKKVVELKPDRIAYRAYTHAPNEFSAQYGIDESALPSSEQKVEFSSLIHTTLQALGYVNIGVDHFVLAKNIPTMNSTAEATRRAHLLNMPNDLLGLGVSAISHIGDYFLQNVNSLESYYNRIAQDEMPVERGLKLSEDDKIRRYIILNFTLQLSLKFADLNSRFRIDFQRDFAAELLALRDLQRQGLIEITADDIKITAKGRPLLRTICCYFDAHLHSQCAEKTASANTVAAV